MSYVISFNNRTFTVTNPDETLNSLKEGTYKIRVVLYGAPGCGKSRFASTFPFRCGVVDLDQGALVYSGDHEIVSIDPDDKRPGGKCECFSTAEAVVDYFLSKPEIEGIVIDSCTTLSDACMNQVQSGKGSWGQNPTQPEYMSALTLLKNLLSKARRANKHLIITAHERWERDEVTGRTWCRPAVAGQFSSTMPVYFAETYHGDPKTINGKQDYGFTTRADNIYTCKSRLDTHLSIPARIQPDFKALWKLIDEKAAAMRKAAP